jgi:UDP:flavonoid glycosyltransferase YjiC (YdhE family)
MPDAAGPMRVLFASMPFDGHFLPLTGLARQLRRQGHDARFYTGASYARRLAALDVPHLPFRRATEVNGDNLAEHFPEVVKLKGPKRIAFDLEKIFFGNTKAHFDDIREIRAEFAFDTLVADGAFYAAYLVAQKLGVPVYGVGPGPTPAPTSPTAPPPFFGLTPAGNPIGRLRHRAVRAMVESTTKPGMRSFNELLADEGLAAYERSVFDLPWDASTLFFQTGVAEMDFPRSDWPANHRFVGPLLPPRTTVAAELPFADKLDRFASVVVVSQGTVDNRDPGKLLMPALIALAGTDHLVVACTGRRHTDALRARFPHDNVVVEDWVDFDTLLPRANLFVCNGGYGSIMHALMNEVPILAAGKLEGKNDINARLAYRGLGLDLKTERPKPDQISAGVKRVLGDPSFKQNVTRVSKILKASRPLETMEAAIVAGPARSAYSPRRSRQRLPSR